MSDITLFRARRIRTRSATIHCAMAGSGLPLLMLHGYPQTHSMWHRVAPELARHHRVDCPDLRGYGDLSKPKGQADHSNYSKRALAQDMTMARGCARSPFVPEERPVEVAAAIRTLLARAA